jgi:hypothetical protein
VAAVNRRRTPLLLSLLALAAACNVGSASTASTVPQSTLERDSVPSTSEASVRTAELTVLGADVNPFSEQVGTWMGGDDPHIYPLPDGRQLWWLNDSFVPVDGKAPVDQFKFVRNVAFFRDADGTMTMLTRTKDDKPWDFLEHQEDDHFHRFYWPLGGEVVGDHLKVFVAEMQCDNPNWGICFRPVSVWLATFTWKDMQLVDLQPAANDGVRPVYGYSVTHDDQWTYLFGTGQEYFTMHLQGGSSQTFVARVPRGRLEDAPTYWDGTGWTADATAAAPIIDDGRSTELRLGIAEADGRYIGVAVEGDFFGDHFAVMSAPAPQGPWTRVAEFPVPTREVRAPVTYDAWPYPVPIDGHLAVMYSTNSTVEKLVFSNPSVYRPVIVLTDIEW